MKRLYRSVNDRRFGGLCGGLGEIMDIDPNLIRVAVVFLCIVTAFFPIIFTYIVGCIIIPEGPVNQ